MIVVVVRVRLYHFVVTDHSVHKVVVVVSAAFAHKAVLDAIDLHLNVLVIHRHHIDEQSVHHYRNVEVHRHQEGVHHHR